MRPLEHIPAVRRIDVDTPGCAAFDLVGHVGASDLENLLGLVEGAAALSPKLDLLLRFTEVDAIDWRQLPEDSMAEGMAAVSRHVGRIAIVDERHFLSRPTGFLGSQHGVEVRHFTPKDEAEAWSWLGMRRTPA